MPRKDKQTYKQVDKLPASAVTVAQFANDKDCNTSYIYKLLREQREGKKQPPFNINIVEFRGLNFIIP